MRSSCATTAADFRKRFGSSIVVFFCKAVNGGPDPHDRPDRRFDRLTDWRYDRIIRGEEKERMMKAGALAVAIILFGFASVAAGQEPTPDPLSESDAKLVFLGPGLAGIVPQRTRTKDIHGTSETGFWTNTFDRFPKATFFLIEAGANSVFVQEAFPTFPDQIKDWYKDVRVDFLQDGVIENVLGRVYFQRYRLNALIECVGVRQFFGDDAGEGPARGFDELSTALGTKAIFGTYCVGPASDIDDATIKAVVGGIGYKPFAVPEKPKSRARQSEPIVPQDTTPSYESPDEYGLNR